MNEAATEKSPEIIELERPYGRFCLAGLLFAAAGLYLAHIASTNERGLIINGIIHLERGSADVFYAVLAALSALFVLGAAFGMNALRLRKTFRIVVGKQTVSIPPPIRAWQGRVDEEVKVRYEDLISLSLSPVGSPAMLKLVRRDGAPLFLSKQFVREGWTLRDISELIMKRARERTEILAAKAAKKARDAGA